MKDAIIVLILAVIAVSIIMYLIRAKKRGQTCIGCSHSKQCGGKCGGNCSHHTH